MQFSININGKQVAYHFSAQGTPPQALLNPAATIIITNQVLANLYPDFFKPFKTLIIQSGEPHKSLETVQQLAQGLMGLQAHKSSFILGVGGGMVTDITGFVASVYMRGLPFGFMPTTLLAMVDAAIGGKNGVNVALHKNMLGTIHQPQHIYFNLPFLKTLSAQEWSNGFAEIIKYCCLFGAKDFNFLAQNNLAYYQTNEMALQLLILKCVDWKNAIVIKDETEQGDRKLLNFGHTLGHAIEQLYDLPHGYAVAIGMVFACFLSHLVLGAPMVLTNNLKSVLQLYNLPTQLQIDTDKVIELLSMDKKRNKDNIDFILLQDIASPIIKSLPISTISQALKQFVHASNS